VASWATFAAPLAALALLVLARPVPARPEAVFALLLALVVDDLAAVLLPPELFAVVRLAAVPVAAVFAVAGLAEARVARGFAGAFEVEPPRLACGISLSLVERLAVNPL
jgi:hypothetical protein